VARPVLPIATETWILVGAFFVYVTLAVLLMRWTENLAKHKGTLVLRHQ
jgi:hypothetical protein